MDEVYAFPVNQHGDRVDLPAIVHNINVLTVVASESYKDFVSGLQIEIAETLSARPRKANEEYFKGKILRVGNQQVEITPRMARQIFRYLLVNYYTDDDDGITGIYHEASDSGKLKALPDGLQQYTDQIFDLIDSVFDDSKLPKIYDGRKPKTNPLNDNFEKRQFQELWSRINRKAVYSVDFDSNELIRKSVSILNSQLKVTPLQYIVQSGKQRDDVTDELLRAGKSFEGNGTSTELGKTTHSDVMYDLIGKVAESVNLTRKTVANILSSIKPAIFSQFQMNPEHFITEATRLINQQKATTIIEQLRYDEIEDRYSTDIFTGAQTGQNLSYAVGKLKKHVYDYCITDSDVEHRFIEKLDTSDEVIVYAKLPGGFLIPTPVGGYNPDWAISFKRGSVKHIYFIAETKGTMSTMKLREIEKTKIECARKFFAELNRRIETNKVQYDIVSDYAKLMDIVNVASDVC